jgi:stress response protein YsnF
LSDTDNSDDVALDAVGSVRSATDAAQIAQKQDEQKLLLFAEELAVRKEVAETGRVRVRTHTVEHEALVAEDLFREQAEIETVPVGKRVYVMPAVRREGDTTIIPIVEEVLHTERRLFLKEEVHIRMVRTTERFQQTVLLRHQEAVVERSHDDAGTAASAAPVPAGK